MGTTRKILIAEDNRINLLLASTILAKALPGVEILEAMDGKEAVDLYCLHDPDLVFMDVQMPEMNGYEATQAIRNWERAKGKRVPVIALTAGAVKGERERCEEAGMDDYLSKPFNKELLVGVMGKWLEI